MGSAYFIILEQKAEGLSTEMDGKGLASHADILDKGAAQTGVRPLSGFVGIDPTQAEYFLRSEGVVSMRELPQLLQFPAEDGLKSVRALSEYVRANPAAFADAEGILEDLNDCERILRAAARHGIRWHFEVDF